MWPWRSLLYLGSTVPIGIAALVVLVVMIGIGLVTAILVIGVLLLAAVPLVTTVIAEAERARLHLVLPSSGTTERATLQERLTGWRRLPMSWSEIGYAALLATVLWVVDAIVLIMAVATPLVLITSPLLMNVTTDERVDLLGWRIDTVDEAWPAVAVGVLALGVAAYVVTAVASGQAALTRIVLDSSEERLASAVTDLRRSRAGLVDAFEIERRRIERDLHDGAQQRLVALTMSLGQAELALEDGPARDLVVRSHTLAEEALADLRTTVRGIHPQVLTDHGLAAAVHELADRSAIPVDTELLLPGRLPAPVEATAYFVVSEALTNIARHADARSAQVQAWVAGDLLTVTIVDDGRGGADPERGTGLAGLVARVEAIDGDLRIISPSGGPTQVRMTCPIAHD